MDEEYGVGDGDGEEGGDIDNDVYNLLQNDAVFEQLAKNLDMGEGEMEEALKGFIEEDVDGENGDLKEETLNVEDLTKDLNLGENQPTQEQP